MARLIDIETFMGDGQLHTVYIYDDGTRAHNPVTAEIESVAIVEEEAVEEAASSDAPVQEAPEEEAPPAPKKAPVRRVTKKAE